MSWLPRRHNTGVFKMRSSREDIPEHVTIEDSIQLMSAADVAAQRAQEQENKVRIDLYFCALGEGR